MRALLSGAAAVVLVAVLSGCSPGDPASRAARDAVTRSLAGDARYDLERIHCTGNPAPWFDERQASVYLCAVRLEEGGCDRYRVTVERETPTVRLDERAAGCTVP